MSALKEQPVHPATPRRRQLARAAGQVAVSRQLVSATAMLTTVGCLFLVGPPLARYLLELTTRQFQRQVAAPAGVSWQDPFRDIFLQIGRITAPALIAIIVVPLCVHLLQTRFHIRLANLAPDLRRLSPAGGVQKMASVHRWAEAGLATIKIVVLLGLALGFLWVRRTELLAVAQLPIHQLGPAICRPLLHVMVAAVLMLLGVAVVDYLLQRWKLERQLMMTPRELRDELREQEGDPTINARRRAVQRQLAAQRAADPTRDPLA
ncbi:MAG: hypothetical protein GTO53_05795 [Planctomycetales bacterium]|nr:hypothetical protein [Planctomycetales bacterium]NIM08657.1 hypothetical protein [Planctomycetales bacterium]NIN08127.1 hypothetical protein [Planctomycetales bacterium]NIN77252.1 hypothetical protein [Planctomycetales bacterium]NIO34441.1 hypothetical protein [Planctomycetales bacterium]